MRSITKIAISPGLSLRAPLWHPLGMSNITNLNQFRKTRERAEKRAQANENAVKFGRTKAQKRLEEAQETQARAWLDAHLCEDDAPRDPKDT